MTNKVAGGNSASHNRSGEWPTIIVAIIDHFAAMLAVAEYDQVSVWMLLVFFL